MCFLQTKRTTSFCGTIRGTRVLHLHNNPGHERWRGHINHRGSLGHGGLLTAKPLSCSWPRKHWEPSHTSTRTSTCKHNTLINDHNRKLQTSGVFVEHLRLLEFTRHILQTRNNTKQTTEATESWISFISLRKVKYKRSLKSRSPGRFMCVTTSCKAWCEKRNI